MKRILNIALIILLPAMVMAQVPAGSSISINVSATVLSDSPVELTTLSNLIVSGNFSGQKDIYISPISNPNAGLMRAKGRPNSQARITYIMEEVLTDSAGAGKITLRYEMSGYTERVQRSAKLIDTGEAILNFGNDGLYYLWVGCHIDIGKAPNGKYTGQFTLQIEYI
jgi:hypothetical protein